MGAGIHDIEVGTFVDGCLEHDRESIEGFFNAFSPRLVRLLRRRVGDPQVAEDLAQETLLKALGALDRFDPTRPMWPWLKTIALNLAIDHARRSDREVPCDEISASMPDESERCHQAMMLDQAMGALPGRHRAALSLRYLNDWRPTDAAQFLGMSRPAFDQLLMRARKRLGVEYQRMQSGLQAVLVLTQARLRSMLQARVAPAWRRVHTSGLPPSAMASVSHVLTAAAVVLTTIASQQAPSPQAPGGGRVIAAPSSSGLSRSGSATNKGGHAKNLGNESELAHGDRAGGSAEQGVAWDPPSNAPLSKAKDITDPHHGVKNPEDVQITSLAFGKDDGSVVYATGRTHCRLPACSPVLFRSTDGGTTWTRREAQGLNGDQIAVPPGKPNMVFAMGHGGLQVSRDKGANFGPAIATGPPMTTGAMAISPRWNEGDPTILVGAQTLLRYRDSTGTADPYVGSLTGPFEPAYSPVLDSDVFFLGALKPNGLSGQRAAVYTCNAEGCNFHGLPDRDQLPKVRPSATDPNLVYAFTEQDLFVSHSRATHFNRIPLPWSGSRILDMETLPTDDRTLIAATAGAEPGESDGLWVSNDGGYNWTRSDNRLFRSGATDIAVTGRRIVVARLEKGLVCSSDGGRTFAARCSS